MRKVSVGRVLAIVALTLLVAGPAFAQENQQVVAGGWAPTVQFGNGSSTTYGKVFFGNLGVPVASQFQVVADLTYLHISGTPSYDGGYGMLGLRYLLPMGSKSMFPFVEGLGGVGYVSLGDNTVYVFSFGGGVDLKTSAPVAFRLQVNYIRTQAANGSGGSNGIRFGIGISNKK